MGPYPGVDPNNEGSSFLRDEFICRQTGLHPSGKLHWGIPAFRIVQRAMLMAMEPIWESDFPLYGFRRTVKLQACSVLP